MEAGRTLAWSGRGGAGAGDGAGRRDGGVCGRSRTIVSRRGVAAGGVGWRAGSRIVGTIGSVSGCLGTGGVAARARVVTVIARVAHAPNAGIVHEVVAVRTAAGLVWFGAFAVTQSISLAGIVVRG